MSNSYKVGNPKVTIFGGSGFVGRYVVYLFAQNGWQISVVVRNPNIAGFLKLYGTEGQISLVKANISDEEKITSAIKGSHAIVNCVGILEEMGGSQKFDLLHNKYIERIAKISKFLGVGRFTHISSIGASENSLSEYSRSKRKGEIEIINNFPEAVILRPSIIFGPEDLFFNRFAKMSLFSPIIPLVGATTNFQPIYVLDIARSVLKSVTDHSFNGIYELGGPDILSFNDLILKMLKTIDRKRLVINVPFGIALFLSYLSGFLKKVSFKAFPSIITKDQVIQLRSDNIVREGIKGIKDFSIKPSSLEIILPDYLWKYRRSGQFSKKESN